MRDVLIALDQGTTSSRALVFGRGGAVLASHACALPQHYPQPGWVEHDPFEILQGQIEALRCAVQKAGAPPESIAAIGIANQRETFVLWDRATGRPVHSAIVWQCRRTAQECDALRREGWEDEVRARTGLLLDPYFSGTKLAWLLGRPGVRERAEAGELLFGTVDTWLAWNLCREKPHVTDPSNASRTMLFNIHDMDWDAEMLRALGIPRAVLPEIADTSGVLGTLREDIIGAPTPVAAIAGDQQAALFGQDCLRTGQAKNTYGTGCFLLMNTGETPRPSAHRLLTTVAWRFGGRTQYALEGSVFIAGAAVQWLRDEMKLIATAEESEAVAGEVPDAGGVVLVPAFAGLGAPYWDPFARGTIVGLTRGSGRAHVVRAALESIAHQTADVVEAMEADAAMPFGELRADGGASRNDLLMQMQADISGRGVLRPSVVETTALGAAKLAGCAVGLQLSGEGEAAGRVFSPRWDGARREAARSAWRRAVACARSAGREA